MGNTTSTTSDEDEASLEEPKNSETKSADKETLTKTEKNNKAKTMKATADPNSEKPKLLSVREYQQQLIKIGKMETDTSEEDSDELQELASKGSEEEYFYVLPTDAHIQLGLHYDKERQKFTVKINRTTHVLSYDAGGAKAYQVCLTLLPDKKLTWRSKIRCGPNPIFSEIWEVPIYLHVVEKLTLQCRLYGCRGTKRVFLFGEAFIPLEKLNLQMDNINNVAFAPKNVKVSSKDLYSDYLTKSDEDEEMNSSDKLVPQKKSSAEEKQGNSQKKCAKLTEVLFSLCLNSKTGQLEICIQKISLQDLFVKKIPKSVVYVKLKLKTETGILKEAKTGKKEIQTNIVINELFAFPVKESQIHDVSFEITLCEKKGVGRSKVCCGLMIGKVNTGKNEKEHWMEIVTTRGLAISRWHELTCPYFGST